MSPDIVRLMKYCVHNLELHRSITAGQGKPAADGTIAILSFISKVAAGELEPTPESHLTDRSEADEIPPGLYLFTQGTCSGTNDSRSDEKEWRDAAEAVWLESLWQDRKFKNARILVRILAEDSRTVFQIFREVEKKQKSDT